MQNRKHLIAISLSLVLILANGCQSTPQPIAQTETTIPSTNSISTATAAEPTAVAANPTVAVAASVIPVSTPEIAETIAPAVTATDTETVTPAVTATTAKTSVAALTTEVVPPRATIPASATNDLATIETLDNITLPRRDAVQLALEFGRTTSTERVARTEPLPDQVGDTVNFWMSNIAEDTYYTTTARLELALDHVLMYVEEGIAFEQADLERSARDFNDRIYPRNRELFGEEWSPGIDGDPRITVLSARIVGAGGYFSGSDEIPRTINRFSNEREMFYMNNDNYPLGSDGYSSTLAHEFQHMIQWRQSVQPSTWFNEGFAQLAEELNGFPVSGVTDIYLAEPDIQLTGWSENAPSTGEHYGPAYLFASYFYERYKAQVDLRQLVKQGAGENVELMADDAEEARPEIQRFDQLYADWAVANLINDTVLEEGRWSNAALPGTVEPTVDDDGILSGDGAQFGTDYIEITPTTSERVLRFDGNDRIGVIADDPEGVMWWSNRGDNATSTLTRNFDLRSVPSATLEFRTWFDIEADYDYAFVSVSRDGGKTWTTLPGQYTTTDDPQGANYGNGYTATSGGATAVWVDESINLTPYVGQEVMIRFSLITDDALNQPGMAIDNIRIPELRFEDDAEADSGDWQSTGWVRTNNELDQRWQLRLVTYEGDTPKVAALTLDAQNIAEVRIPANTRAVLVVMATTPHTSERAEYSVSRP